MHEVNSSDTDRQGQKVEGRGHKLK